MSLKILSWNIWGGQYLPEIMNFLRAANADIIGLQEVIEDLDGSKNTAKIIAEELGYEWVYVPTYKDETAKLYKILEPKTVKRGNAILSKYKIVDYEAHKLSEEKKGMVLEASIPVNGRNLHIFSTHLVHTHQQPLELQNFQAENLLKFIPEKDAIVMGDFNATPGSECLKIVSNVLKNTDENLSASTWSVYPEGCPKCNPQAIDTRLDYIFTTEDMRIESFEVGNSKGSDHLPISAMLEG